MEGSLKATLQPRTFCTARAATILFFWTLLALGCSPAQPPIFKHVVIILQENRPPDNVFGSNPHFEPGVDLATSGLNSKGETIPLLPLPIETCFDLNHSHKA